MLNKMFLKIKKNKKAFSIVEVLISLAVVSIAFVAILSLSFSNVSTQTYNKNQLVASMLAQEGVELVRNLRDQNWLDGNNFSKDILDTDGTFVIDEKNFLVDDTPNNINDDETKLYLNSDGFYEHDSTGTSTPFRRLMEVSSVSGGIYLKTTVRWYKANKPYDYIIETEFYDWK